MKSSLAVVLGALVAGVFWVAPALACTCSGSGPKFLIADGATIPANAVGIPYWEFGPVPRYPVPYGTRAEDVPLDARFAVEKIAADGAVPVPFELRPLRDALLYGFVDFARPDNKTFLIAPVGGFEPGARYRFRAGGLAGERSLEVSVSRDSLVAIAGQRAALKRSPQRQEPLRVYHPTACTGDILAARVDVAMQLPPALARWRDALLYTTRVAGFGTWRPKPHQCDPTPLGASWTGKGRETLFAHCDLYGWRTPLGESLYGALPAGDYAVEMTAWLPGAAFEIAATTSVRLGCAVQDSLDLRQQRDSLRFAELPGERRRGLKEAYCGEFARRIAALDDARRRRLERNRPAAERQAKRLLQQVYGRMPAQAQAWYAQSDWGLPQLDQIKGFGRMGPRGGPGGWYGWAFDRDFHAAHPQRISALSRAMGMLEPLPAVLHPDVSHILIGAVAAIEYRPRAAYQELLTVAVEEILKGDAVGDTITIATTPYSHLRALGGRQMMRERNRGLFFLGDMPSQWHDAARYMGGKFCADDAVAYGEHIFAFDSPYALGSPYWNARAGDYYEMVAQAIIVQEWAVWHRITVAEMKESIRAVLESGAQ